MRPQTLLCVEHIIKQLVTYANAFEVSPQTVRCGASFIAASTDSCLDIFHIYDALNSRYLYTRKLPLSEYSCREGFEASCEIQLLSYLEFWYDD